MRRPLHITNHARERAEERLGWDAATLRINALRAGVFGKNLGGNYGMRIAYQGIVYVFSHTRTALKTLFPHLTD